jgi:hypothetical protein
MAEERVVRHDTVREADGARRPSRASCIRKTTTSDDRAPETLGRVSLALVSLSLLFMSRTTAVLQVRESPTSAETPRRVATTKRAFWVKQFYLWHWVSSAFALVGMLFFAITGITLNHSASLTAKPVVKETRESLPPSLHALVALPDGGADVDAAEVKRALPRDLRRWLARNLSADPGARAVEWTAEEIYVDLPRPGGDGWLTIDRETGEVMHSETTRGVIAWLNDLHKGRHTGTVWILFMDAFSVISVIFCLTGLGLLVVHARRRPMTWPVVLAGLIVPAIVVVFFLHV